MTLKILIQVFFLFVFFAIKWYIINRIIGGVFMKCSKCGNPLTGKENFCRICGTPVDKSQIEENKEQETNKDIELTDNIDVTKIVVEKKSLNLKEEKKEELVESDDEFLLNDKEEQEDVTEKVEEPKDDEDKKEPLVLDNDDTKELKSDEKIKEILNEMNEEDVKSSEEDKKSLSDIIEEDDDKTVEKDSTEEDVGSTNDDVTESKEEVKEEPTIQLNLDEDNSIEGTSNEVEDTSSESSENSIEEDNSVEELETTDNNKEVTVEEKTEESEEDKTNSNAEVDTNDNLANIISFQESEKDIQAKVESEPPFVEDNHSLEQVTQNVHDVNVEDKIQEVKNDNPVIEVKQNKSSKTGVIILSILCVIILLGAIILGILFVSKNDEVSKNSSEIDKLEQSVKDLKEELAKAKKTTKTANYNGYSFAIEESDLVLINDNYVKYNDLVFSIKNDVKFDDIKSNLENTKKVLTNNEYQIVNYGKKVIDNKEYVFFDGKDKKANKVLIIYTSLSDSDTIAFVVNYTSEEPDFDKLDTNFKFIEQLKNEKKDVVIENNLFE
jgi:hypothetical protein